MIGSVLNFLRTNLDAELRRDAEESATEKLVFVDGDKMEPLEFKLGAVSMLLVNVEEERVLRPGDRYSRVGGDGTISRVFPEIRLQLQLLFVARFKRYDEAWDQLAGVISHFQSRPYYDRHNTPGLPAGVEKLVFELRTLSFAEQNEIWNALRVSHHPSMLYRVSMLVLRDAQADAPAVAAGESQRRLGMLGESGGEG